ncbi:MAG: methylmalonyl-CoA mutase [Deltaproteobacteria bacterium]|nr:methylmalonyl-CoA mutase [Deltaproteobacteria bacterium]
MKEDPKRIKKLKEEWQRDVVAPKLGRYNLQKDPTRFYTSVDLEGFNFEEKIGFPGQFPFTAGNDPVPRWQAFAAEEARKSNRFEYGTSHASRYGGFGTPEDYRGYLLRMHEAGRMGGPNMAFDLPTQIGLDSDDPRAEGEVGHVGVAIDSLRDFELIYEPYRGDIDLDKISSNFTINAPAIIIIAMYASLAEKRGISLKKLRGTPQNDILKEFLARGTQIFPPRPSMRLFRDSLVFMTRNMPLMNITSMGSYHFREAGATREQALAFSMAIGASYLQAGTDAGLHVDEFAPQFTFNGFSGSMEFYWEIAFQRAARRMWATIVKKHFGAKDPKSMMVRQMTTASIGAISMTLQRPLNNLTRAVVGGMAGGMSGGIPFPHPPYDEPLGLGHSLEAQQLVHDAGRILIYESKLGEVLDPWAGSYFMESITNEIEEAAWAEFEKVKGMGGAVTAIETGYMQKEVARSAYEKQKCLENGEDFIVGVNCFTGPHELEVKTERQVPGVYDQELKETAGERRCEDLKQLKGERDSDEVARTLKALENVAKQEDENVMPCVIECVKSYATIQEICDVFRGVFGEAESVKI